MKPALKKLFAVSEFGLVASLALTAALSAANAQQPENPTPYAMPPEIPALQDVAFPGTIVLAVDATDTAHGIFRVHETIPVEHPGPLVLLYPRWLPGHHSPNGPIDL